MEIQNKFGNIVKVFANIFEPEAYDQIERLANSEAYGHAKIRVMPDAHTGKGCVVGTTIQLTDKVTPNLVGVDIGCGMQVTKLEEKEIDLQKLDRFIRENIPTGFNIRDTPLPQAAWFRSEKMHCAACLNTDIVTMNSIGTLGGGNHFIEIDRSDDGDLYLVIHSGSRNLGVRVCQYYQHLAIMEDGNRDLRLQRAELIERLKAEGRQKDIAKELARLPHPTPSNKELAYLTGSNFDEYIHDMQIAQQYAILNRYAMTRLILNGMNLHRSYSFETIHNYINKKDMILRKGAVSARQGEKLIIPMNMRDGALLCIGKGNPDWNFSAPHGAGRLMSRRMAKESISMEEYEETMTGIFSTSVCESTIDESPQAYKPMAEIISQIGDTLEVKEVIRPIYNFKDSGVC